MRVHPSALYEFGQIFDHEDFERLCNQFEFRTMKDLDLSVGGRGVVWYGRLDLNETDFDEVEAVDRRLGLTVRRMDH